MSTQRDFVHPEGIREGFWEEVVPELCLWQTGKERPGKGTDELHSRKREQLLSVTNADVTLQKF